MDLISRQGFDKFLEDAEKEAVKNRKYVFASALNTIRGNLRNFPSAQQWIPCSERLPEEEGYYLTTTMYQKVYCDYWNGDNFDRTEMVVAWMPLPEPWKGEQNE